MHFSLISAAAVLAVSTPVLATPLPDVTVVSGSQTTTSSFQAVSIRDNFCHGGKSDIAVTDQSDYTVGTIIAVEGEVNCFGSRYNKRMNTPAHITYEKALFLYQDIHHLIIHTLTKKGMARFTRLVEIAAKIQRSYEFLEEAEGLNKHDKHHIRRKWIRYEIKNLRGKLDDARWLALHLPNLALCEEAFHFVVDVSLKVVEFIVEIPLVVGAAVGAAIHWAAHAVVEAFHFIGHVLKWTIKGIAHAFIKFHRKIKKAIKKVGEEIHKIGHHIKEDLKDVGSIILDIGHHIFGHHHCEKGDFGVIVVTAGEQEQECGYEEDDLCLVGEKQCTREEFTMKAQMHYDIEFTWTKEESVQQVTQCMTKVNQAFIGMKAELQEQEVKVVAANWEAAEDESSEEADE
jgi:hypothetical protein